METIRTEASTIEVARRRRIPRSIYTFDDLSTDRDPEGLIRNVSRDRLAVVVRWVAERYGCAAYTKHGRTDRIIERPAVTDIHISGIVRRRNSAGVEGTELAENVRVRCIRSERRILGLTRKHTEQ